MAGAFLRVEGLINCPVEIEHEVDAEESAVVQDEEALAAGAADVVVEDELVHVILERGQIPAVGADVREGFVGEGGAAHAVTLLRGGEIVGVVGVGGGDAVDVGEMALERIGVVAVGVAPQHDAGAGVKKLSGDDDFVAGARGGDGGWGGFRCGSEWNGVGWFFDGRKFCDDGWLGAATGGEEEEAEQGNCECS